MSAGAKISAILCVYGIPILPYLIRLSKSDMTLGYETSKIS